MNEYDQNLMKLCADVLQDTVFLFTDDWDDSFNYYATISIFVRINFTGDKNGFFLIGTTDHISKLITQNMLGIDSDDSVVEEKKYDAIKEVANILCGHILTYLFGENSNFNIFEPFIISENDFNSISEDLFNKFIVEDNPFVFHYNIEQ